jgi:hypothetical protein
LITWHIIFGINSIDWTFWNADSAIDALIRINDQEVRTLTETIHWANINAIGVFTTNTSFSYNISHGINLKEDENRYFILDGAKYCR